MESFYRMSFILRGEGGGDVRRGKSYDKTLTVLRIYLESYNCTF